MLPGGFKHIPSIFWVVIPIHPRSLTARPRKMVVGRQTCLSYWVSFGIFSGANLANLLLNFGRGKPSLAKRLHPGAPAGVGGSLALRGGSKLQGFSHHGALRFQLPAVIIFR